MLIALFTILFLSGGSSTPFVVPKAEKLIKQVVVDDTRREEILELMAEYKDDWKALNNEKKSQSKELKGLIENQDTDLNQVSAMLQTHRDKRNLLNQELIAYRMAIMKQITEDERQELSGLIKEKFVENEEKMAKKSKKALDKATKKLTSIEEAIIAAYDDPELQIEAGKLLNQFSDDIVNLLKQTRTYAKETMQVHTGMTNQDDKNLSEMVYKVESYRAQAHTSFLLLYQGLVKITPEEDWSKVSKQLQKLI